MAGNLCVRASRVQLRWTAAARAEEQRELRKYAISHLKCANRIPVSAEGILWVTVAALALALAHRTGKQQSPYRPHWN